MAKYLKIYLLFLMLFATAKVFAQKSENQCIIKSGKMQVLVKKNITEMALDSFVAKFELADLDLKTCLKTNKLDTLLRMGWAIEKNDPIDLIITKSLEAFGGIKNPGEITSFTDINKTERQQNEDFKKSVAFGFNNFYDNIGFAQKDSIVTFMMRGNLNAKKVYLAGNFNKWNPNDILMLKNDTGWVVNIKLNPGKYYYKFIVDGNWVFDRDNRMYENDMESNTNSLFFVNNVVFTLKGFEKAKKVFVAGSFNNWKPNKLKMVKTVSGWQFPAYLANGTYTYKFVVDGKWMEDPENSNKYLNEYSEFNSVLSIGNPNIFKLADYTNASKVYLYGSFNNWKRLELKMQKAANGWELPYALNTGNYDYLYEVNGKQIWDSIATKTNGFNTKFSLIVEPNYTFKIKGLNNAKTVLISGDFNNWSPDGFTMRKEGDVWEISMHLNPGKRLYKLIVDGKWIKDPSNPQWEQNEFSTGNSFFWFMP